jgi:EasF-like predicted methyltransferase
VGWLIRIGDCLFNITWSDLFDFKTENMEIPLAPNRSDLLDRQSGEVSLSATQTISALHHPSITLESGIIDIRSSDASLLDGLDSSILDGLRQPKGQKTLPSLLLWGEKGQMLYDDLLVAEEYYPYRVENELLRSRVDEIAETIAASGADLLVELGAGNLSKTIHFLSALDKQLTSPLVYYALDVDRSQIERSLAAARRQTSQFRWIKLCGLLGTYEDGARWLARPEMAPFRTTLVWLGSSIANYEQEQASELLASFTAAKHPTTTVDSDTPQNQNLAGVLLLVDGCQDAARIELAYDVPSGKSRRWITHAVEAARRHLRVGGTEDDDECVDWLLADKHWAFEGQWHPERQRYQNYLVPRRDLEGTIRGQPIRLAKGERVAVIGSGKWTRATLSGVAAKSGLEVSESWHNSEFNYGEMFEFSILSCFWLPEWKRARIADALLFRGLLASTKH